MKPEIGSVSPSKKRRQLANDQVAVCPPEPANQSAISPRMGAGGRGPEDDSLGTQPAHRLIFRPSYSTPDQQSNSTASGSQDAGSTAESESGVSDFSVVTGMTTPAAPVTPLTPIDSGYATPFSPFSAYASTQPRVQSVARDESGRAQSPMASSLHSISGAKRQQWNAGSPYQDRGRPDQSSNSSNSSNSSSNGGSSNTSAQAKEKRSRSPVKALLDKAKRRFSAPSRKAGAERTHGRLPPSPAPAIQSDSPLSPEFQYKEMARNLEEGNDSSSIGSPTPQSPPLQQHALAGDATRNGQGIDSIGRARRNTAPTVSPSKPASGSQGYVNPSLIFSQCEVLISTLMNTTSLQAKSGAVVQALENFVSILTHEQPDGEKLRAAFSEFQSTLRAQSESALERNAVARGLLTQLEEAIRHFPNPSSANSDLFSPGYRLHLNRTVRDFRAWVTQ